MKKGTSFYKLNNKGSSMFHDIKQEISPYTPLEGTQKAPSIWGYASCNTKNCEVKNGNIFMNLRENPNQGTVAGCYSNPYNAPNTEEDCWRQPDPYSQAFRLGETPLSRAFFTPENVDFHRKEVARRIKEKYGMDIGVQPFRPTEFFMMKTFQDVNCDMCQDKGLVQGLEFLNKYTADGLEQRIARNLGQHIGYLRFMDEASWGLKIDNPRYTRPTYKDALSLSSYYNGCPYQL